MNKQEFLNHMKALGACAPAVEYIETHESDDAQVIWETCTRISWLVWVLNRVAPKAYDKYYSLGQYELHFSRLLVTWEDVDAARLKYLQSLRINPNFDQTKVVDEYIRDRLTGGGDDEA